MRVLSWNVAGRQRSLLAKQLANVLEREPDVVALQEVTLGTHEAWRAGRFESQD